MHNSKLTEEDREKRRLQRLAKEEEEYEQRELDRRKRAREDAYREVTFTGAGDVCLAFIL